MRMKDEEWQSILDSHLTLDLPSQQGCLRGMTKARKADHQHRVGGGCHRQRGDRQLCGGEGGMIGYTKVARRDVWAAWASPSRSGAGFINTPTHAPPWNEEQRRRAARLDPPGPLGAPRDRRRGGLPGLRRSLHHRRDDSRQWRMYMT